MKPRLHLLVACLLTTLPAQAGEIFYGRNTGGPLVSQFQIMRMDDSGQNRAAVFPVGAAANPDAFASAARVAHVSYGNYNTSFAQGRMWLYSTSVVNPTAGDQELHVFARNANGRLVERQVTDFLSSGRVGVVPNGFAVNTRWSLDDSFISCEVDEFSTGLSYAIRIAVSGQEIASDNFVPIPFFDPANPVAVNRRIEILVRVNHEGHAWNAEGTRLAYFDSNAGFRVRTVGPLGTFAGPTEPTLDPVLLPLSTFSFWTADIEWRPVVGSDQLVFFATEQLRKGTRNGLYFAYANTGTWKLFLENVYDSKTRTTPAYRYPTCSADGGTVLMMNGDWVWSNGPTYVCKVPVAGGTVVTLTTAADATLHLDLYGAR